MAASLARFVPAERILTEPVQTESYSYDASFATRLKRHRPDVVVRAAGTEEVSGVVRWCHTNGVPVYPRGAATAQSGGSVAVRGGVSLDLTPMKRIVAMLPDDLQVVCEAGVIHADLNDALAEHRLFFAPDPGSSRMCTIGGMVANNSSGLRAVKYGQTRHHVLGLEVVLPDGQVIETGGVGSRALKTVSGYEMTALFVGSEGTLGVITQARIKALPLPARRALSLTLFDTLEAAGRAVQRVFRAGILPSAIEILDTNAILAIQHYRPDVALPSAEALLLFEAEGEAGTVKETARQIERACDGLAREIRTADEPEHVASLWEARRVVGAAVARVKQGYTRVYGGEDVCVPISAIPRALDAIHDLGRRQGIHIAIYGHVGDGNIHAAPIINMRDPEQVERAKALIEQIHELALSLHGTTTGEHGVGLVRSRYMEREHGPALDAMRLLKKAFDPDNLMNPGKMGLEEGEPRGPYE